MPTKERKKEKGIEKKMQIFIGRKKKMKSNNNAKSKTPPQQNSKRSRCHALCCGSSRLSVSSTTTTCSELVGSSDTEQINNLSNMAHGMVQARLEHIVSESSHQKGLHRRHISSKPVINTCTSGVKKYVVLVATERYSHDPTEDFRKSIMEVITCNDLVEPKELKGLLNCLVSINSREHRQAILEAFVDVCSALFLCKNGGYALW